MAMKTTFSDALSRYVGRDAKIVSKVGGGLLLKLWCEGCKQEHDALNTGTQMNPQAYASLLRSRGWRIGKHNLCPDYQKVRRPSVINSPPLRVVESPTQSLNSTDKAREAKRLAIMSLEDYFDIPSGSYRAGKSDAIIGKDCGLAEAAVAKLREEVYGPLKPPSELLELHQAVTKAKTEIERLRTEIGSYAHRLTGLAKKQGWSAHLGAQ